VATFCKKVWSNEVLEIDIDKILPLIYVQDVVKEMLQRILRDLTSERFSALNHETVILTETTDISVGKIKELLVCWHDNYLRNAELPDFSSEFNKKLFLTFLTYAPFEEIYPMKLNEFKDHRGSFVEAVRLASGGQVSFSTTLPGVTRGNHFHTRKIERFIVLEGEAQIEFRKFDSDKKYSFSLSGKTPSFVDMPIWHTHNITNIGENVLVTLFWINEPFDSSNGDTYFLEVI
jgi:UDP-2-acetamido-2,6-beta-L-arabino-hexul-4-ose reductase